MLTVLMSDPFLIGICSHRSYFLEMDQELCFLKLFFSADSPSSGVGKKKASLWPFKGSHWSHLWPTLMSLSFYPPLKCCQILYNATDKEKTLLGWLFLILIFLNLVLPARWDTLLINYVRRVATHSLSVSLSHSESSSFASYFCCSWRLG